MGQHGRVPSVPLRSTAPPSELGTGSPPEALRGVGELLDALGVGYAAVDARWRYLAFNQTAAAMGMTTPEQVIGQEMWLMYPAMVGSDFETRYRRAVATGAPEVFEAFYPEPLNITVEVTARPRTATTGAAQATSALVAAESDAAGGRESANAQEDAPGSLPAAGAGSAGPAEMPVATSSMAAGCVLELVFTDVTEHRASDLALSRASRRNTTIGALGQLALSLTDAESITDLVTVMAEQGLKVLAADGGAVAVPDAEAPGVLRSYITSSYGAQVQADYGLLPIETALPVCAAAVTGEAVLLRDELASRAFSAEMAEVVTATECRAWASLPLRAAGHLVGVLTAGWVEPQALDSEQVALLETYAAQCAQALARLNARDAEHTATVAAQDAAQLARAATASAEAATAVAQAATSAALAAGARQGALVAIAGALAGADSRREVLEVLADQGTALLGANGCGLHLRQMAATGVLDGGQSTTGAGADAGAGAGVGRKRGAGQAATGGVNLGAGAATGVVVSEVTDGYAAVRAAIARLPVDYPLPPVRSAATGSAIYLGDGAETEAAFPGSASLYADAGVQASASVPLRARGQLIGSLSMGFAHPRAWSEEDRGLLTAFAAMTAQAVDRIAAHDAEQAALKAASSIAVTLQRAMLTDPPEPDHLEVVVRYAATARAAQVGGDWYDAFITSAGITSLVIGDVTGHDMAAAAVMGQMRNLVRGIGFTLSEPPASVLSAVDRAAIGLGVSTITTAVLAQVDQSAEHRAAGTRLLRWSNAGHPAPLLIEPVTTTHKGQPDPADTSSGSARFQVRFLDTEPDLVLGWDPSIARHDHEVVLAPGAIVLMYTDGLVERRGAGLEAGMAWLADTVSALLTPPVAESTTSASQAGEVTLQELCDGLLAQVQGHLDDDVALVALRAHPEDAPRPLEAGPTEVPPGLDAAQPVAADVETSTD